MSSSKSLNLLAVAHNYRTQGKRVMVLKPRLDSRFGAGSVTSRAGLSTDADMLLDADTLLETSAFEGCHCILVDEAQFLSTFVIDQLRLLTKAVPVPVICYGLRTDFKMMLFEGSKRLLELADCIEEVKCTCQFCNRKAVFNMRFIGEEPARSGEQIQLGDTNYFPLCFTCFDDRLPLEPKAPQPSGGGEAADSAAAGQAEAGAGGTVV